MEGSNHRSYVLRSFNYNRVLDGSWTSIVVLSSVLVQDSFDQDFLGRDLRFPSSPALGQSFSLQLPWSTGDPADQDYGSPAPCIALGGRYIHKEPAHC